MVTNNELRRGGITLLIMMVLANFINYLFQVLMGRMLTVEEFGTMNALFSWVLIISMPIGVVTTTTARYVANYNAKGESNKIARFIKLLLGYLAWGAGGVALIGILFSPLLSRYMNINNVLLVVMLAITLSSGMFFPLLTGTVQGTKRFLSLGLLGFGQSAVKLVLGVGLVWLGYRLFGVMVALIVTNLAMTLVGLYMIRGYLKKRELVEFEDLTLGKRDIASYTLIAFAVILGIAFLSNTDMIFVKRFFSESQAGLYGTAVLFERFVLYIPNALVLAMFPIAAEAEATGNGSTSVAVKTLLYVGGLAILCAVGLNLFTEQAVTLLMGAKYLAAVPYVRLTSLMAVPIGLMLTLANYCLAIRKLRVLTWSLLVGCIGCAIFIEVYHQSITNIIGILSATAIVLFVFNLVYLLRTKGPAIIAS